MNAISKGAATAAIVAVGTVSNGKGIGFKYVIGSMFYTVALVALTSAIPDVANPIGTLVLVAAISLYVPTIAKKLGLI